MRNLIPSHPYWSTMSCHVNDKSSIAQKGQFLLISYINGKYLIVWFTVMLRYEYWIYECCGICKQKPCWIYGEFLQKLEIGSLSFGPDCSCWKLETKIVKNSFKIVTNKAAMWRNSLYVHPLLNPPPLRQFFWKHSGIMWPNCWKRSAFW